MVSVQNKEKGQSLLVIILLISVVFTVIAAASFRFTTETQTTKLQEDTIRALAAADSGIEKGLQIAGTIATTAGPQTFASQNLTFDGINSQLSTLEVKKTNSRDFATATINKDEQYTFYFYNYPTNNANPDNYYKPSTNGYLNLYFMDGSTDCTASPRQVPALEVTLIYGNGTSSNQLIRFVIEPCNLAPQRITGTSILTGLDAGGIDIAGTQFNRLRQFDLTTYASGGILPKLLIVRTFFAPTKLGFRASNSGGTLFAQGQEVTVKAVSNSGTSRQVQLFKPNPQIPSDYFVTTF